MDRVVQVALLGMVGMGWLMGAGLALWVTRGPEQGLPEWMVWSMALLPAAVFLGAGLYKAKGGWRLEDMRKGATAEERVGQVIEYALTSEGCAVAHGVEGIAKVGDIDHLVATPRGLWVIETKHGRVPKREFRETLRRIAVNVEAVREWAAGMQVTGCLVFPTEPKKRPKPTYRQGAETIRCFADAESLMRELRTEARAGGGGSRIAREVWRLAKVEGSQPEAGQADGANQDVRTGSGGPDGQERQRDAATAQPLTSRRRTS